MEDAWCGSQSWLQAGLSGRRAGWNTCGNQVGQAPWTARDALVPLLLLTQSIAIAKRPTRGSAADVGVRPTHFMQMPGIWETMRHWA